MKIRYLLLLTVLVIAMSSLFSINSFAAYIDDTDLVTLEPGPYKWADDIGSCSDFSLSIPKGAVTTEYGAPILIEFYHELNDIPVMEYRFSPNSGYSETITICYGAFIYSQYLNLKHVVDVPVELTKYLLPVSELPDEPDVPDPVPEPDEPEPEDPVTPSEPGEISIPIRDGHTLEYIYEFTIYDKPIDFLKQTVEGDEVVLEFVYSDLSTQYIRYKVPQHLEYEFTGLYVHFTDGSSTNIPKDYYRSVRGKELDHFRLGYVRAFSRCDLYFEGRGFSSIDFPMRDVAKIAIEKSYSDSYNNFDVYLQFNDGTTTFFEFSSVLPKVEGKTFAGFYIYDTENNVNVGDYIPCDGEFHDINQSGDFALNTCFLEYKSDFAVNFMNWSGTFTVRSFPFYTDLDYVIVTQDNKGITVEHYTPGADGELYVVDSEFFDDDTYVGIQKKPNRVNNFVEDDEFPLHIYISDKDVTYYLAPPDYEYLYDIHLGHETSKDNEELMDSISDALADLDLPDTGDFSLQIDAIFDNSGYYRYMDIFKNILEFDLFTSLLVVSFVMAMAGYVLFGKRG